MTATSDIKTARGNPRTELAAVFRGNPRLVKAIEDLLRDVSQTLPDASDANAAAASQAQATADGAADQAETATIAAAAAQATADDALATGEDSQADPGNGALWAEFAALRSRIASLEQGITP